MKPARFWPLATIILLPVLVLAAGVLYGVHQLEERYHRDQKAKMEPVLDDIYLEFRDMVEAALEASPPVFPEPSPPVPEASSTIDDHFEKLGRDVAKILSETENEDEELFNSTWMALRAIRDNLELDDFRNASGLPVRTMAAWHMWQLTRSKDDGEALGRVALECPSVLTDVFLEKMLAAAPPGADWPAPICKAWTLSRERRWVVEAALAPMGSSVHHRRESMVGEPGDDDGTETMVGLAWPKIAPGEYGLILSNPDRTQFFRDHAGKAGLWVVSRCEKAKTPGISRTAMRTLSPEELAAMSEKFIARAKKSYPIPAWAELYCPDLQPNVPEAHLGFGMGTWIRRGGPQSGVPEIAFRIWDGAAYMQGQLMIRKWAHGLIAAAALISLTGLTFAGFLLRKERRLGELKSQFVSSVSHELRAPIGSMRLMAEGLATGRVKGEAAGEFHRLMAGEGARLSALIENVLDFARIEQGRKEYQMAETDVAALLGDAVALMQPQAEAKGLRILLECEPLPFVPRVDAGALQQAVVNLLDNAVKFTQGRAAGEGADKLDASGLKTIRVRLAAEAGGWSITVTDPGIGIPAAEHARIFERFYRLGNELRRETTGTGIGLAIVKHIVEGHGGRVTVRSVVGQGSEFRMEFVRVPEEGFREPPPVLTPET